MVRYIGDIHAEYYHYLTIISSCESSVQVGDFGIGFRENPIETYDTSKHRFIRGNHDYPYGCKKEPNWIYDGAVEKVNGTKVMYIGGASSIDIDRRTLNIDWWEDEELSNSDMNLIREIYSKEKPDRVVSHECPAFLPFYFNKRLLAEQSRTRFFLQELYEIHKPKEWIFGHWHFSFDKTLDDTRFVCLDINDYIDL